jgi:hypothetical protein
MGTVLVTYNVIFLNLMTLCLTRTVPNWNMEKGEKEVAVDEQNARRCDRGEESGHHI